MQPCRFRYRSRGAHLQDRRGNVVRAHETVHEEISRTEFFGPLSVRLIAAVGEDEQWHLSEPGILLDPLDERKTTQVRHLNARDEVVSAVLLEPSEGLEAIAAFGDVKPLGAQRNGERSPDMLVVVNEEDVH